MMKTKRLEDQLSGNMSIHHLKSVYRRLQDKEEGSIHNNSPGVRKVLAWLVTGFNASLTWLGCYAFMCNVIALIPFCSNPVIILVSAILAFFQGLLMAGLDMGDVKKAIKLNLFRQNQENNDLLQRIKLSQKLYPLIAIKINDASLSKEAINYLYRLVKINNTLIKRDYQKIYPNKKERIATRIARWTFLLLNSLLHFSSGFMVVKGLLCLVGLAMLPNPIFLGVAALGGALAFTSFILLKTPTVFRIFNALLGKVNPLPKKDIEFIFGKYGVGKYENTLKKALNAFARSKTISDKSTLITIKNASSQHTKRKKLNFITYSSRAIYEPWTTNNKFNFFIKNIKNDIKYNAIGTEKMVIRNSAAM